MSNKIIIYPSPFLRKVSMHADMTDLKNIKNLILDLSKIMKESDGIGLAAPQIGINTQVAVVFTKDGALPLINPKILKRSLKKEIMEEGCLSIPKVFGLVKRPYQITVETYNENGEKIKMTANGLLARTIMHEIDHLNGILFIDNIIKITSGQELLEKYESEK